MKNMRSSYFLNIKLNIEFYVIDFDSNTFDLSEYFYIFKFYSETLKRIILQKSQFASPTFDIPRDASINCSIKMH